MDITKKSYGEVEQHSFSPQIVNFIKLRQNQEMFNFATNQLFLQLAAELHRIHFCHKLETGNNIDELGVIGLQWDLGATISIEY